MTRKPALGRGLDALIGAGARRRDSLELAGNDTSLEVTGAALSAAADDASEDRLERLPLGQLTRGKYQRPDLHYHRLRYRDDSR